MKTTLKGRLNQMQIDKAFTRVCKFKRKLKRNTIDNILAIVSGARRPPKRIIPNQITTLKCAYKMFLVVARQGWTTELPFKNTCVASDGRGTVAPSALLGRSGQSSGLQTGTFWRLRFDGAPTMVPRRPARARARGGGEVTDQRERER